MGTRGDDLRWELMHLTVLPSQAYKLILGIDYMKRRKGKMDLEKMTLQLTKEEVTYTLPLKDKKYALNAPSIRAYENYVATSGTAAAPQQVSAIDINEVELNEIPEDICNGEEERRFNAVG